MIKQRSDLTNQVCFIASHLEHLVENVENVRERRFIHRLLPRLELIRYEHVPGIDEVVSELSKLSPHLRHSPCKLLDAHLVQVLEFVEKPGNALFRLND